MVDFLSPTLYSGVYDTLVSEKSASIFCGRLDKSGSICFDLNEQSRYSN